MSWRNPGKGTQNRGLIQEACSRELPRTLNFGILKTQKPRKPLPVKGTGRFPWGLGSLAPQCRLLGSMTSVFYVRYPGVPVLRGWGSASPSPERPSHCVSDRVVPVRNRALTSIKECRTLSFSLSNVAGRGAPARCRRKKKTHSWLQGKRVATATSSFQVHSSHGF